jgi:hypothetical protein
MEEFLNVFKAHILERYKAKGYLSERQLKLVKDSMDGPYNNANLVARDIAFSRKILKKLDCKKNRQPSNNEMVVFLGNGHIPGVKRELMIDKEETVTQPGKNNNPYHIVDVDISDIVTLRKSQGGGSWIGGLWKALGLMCTPTSLPQRSGVGNAIAEDTSRFFFIEFVKESVLDTEI